MIENIEDIYKDYDLVQGKPAAVLIKLNLPEQLEKPYSIGLQINNKKINTKCSIELEKANIEEKNLKFNLKQRRCKLKEGSFKRLQRKIKKDNIKSLYYFVELPTQNEIFNRVEKKEVSLFIEDQNQNPCSNINFSVFMRKTDKLHLDFISLEYDDNEQNKMCKQNEVSDFNIKDKFANSDEVKKYLPMMYPIREDYFSSRAINYGNLKAFKCDNTKHDRVDASIGLLFDVSTADIGSLSNYLDNWDTDDTPLQTKEGYYLLNRKLIVIVSRNYMKFHGLEDTNGFIIAPLSIETGEGFGSWNVAFIVDEALEDKLASGKKKPQGIVLHEVAHLLGQGKEYYAKRYPNTDDPLPDNQQDWFCNFPGKSREPCHKHRVFGGFHANFNLQFPWKLLNGKFPFMNNEPTKIENMWIDRKTYQKLFRTLHQDSLDPTDSRSQSIIQKSLFPVVSLSGVYDKKRGVFYENFSMAYKGLPTLSQQKGDIEIALIETIKREGHIKSRVISTIKVSTNMKMELISNNGGKAINLNTVPIAVSLPLPQKYLTDKKARNNLKIRVRETFYRNVKTSYKPGHKYIHHVSFEGSKGQSNLKNGVTKKRKVLYNAPINWEFKPEDLIIKK